MDGSGERDESRDDPFALEILEPFLEGGECAGVLFGQKQEDDLDVLSLGQEKTVQVRCTKIPGLKYLTDNIPQRGQKDTYPTLSFLSHKYVGA